VNASTRLFARIVEVARGRGVDSDALCRDAGFDPAALADVEGSLPIEPYFKLWALAVGSTDPAFPLAVACNFAGVHNLLRFVCKASDTVATALDRAAKYLPAMSDSTRWNLEPRSDGAVVVSIERLTPASWPGTAFANEYTLAEIVNFGRYMSQTEWRPTAVTFAHPESAAATEFRAFFACPVEYSAGQTSVTLPEAVLALPLVEPDAAALAFFSQLLEKRMPETTSVVVDPEGQWIIAADGTKTSLARKATLRKILRRLIEARFTTPGEPVRSEELIELGWPEEQIAHAPAMNRLRVAIARLRGAGLEAMLVGERGGYWLDPAEALTRG
jgi:hypothetical protein